MIVKIRIVLQLVLRVFLLSRLCLTAIADFPNPGFFQTNKVLSLALDGTDEFSSDVFPALGVDEGKIPASPVRFEPPYLDFKEHPVGQPHLEQVTLINGVEKKPVQLLSISATTPHFHCSFFQRKVVPPGENTTFDVVFLAREIGATENTLFIRTSTGTYRYQLFAVGVTSPYRVQPWLGARIPINSSFSPYLHVHNPHDSPLQITEMFTSGPDLHLELPHSPPGTGPPPSQLWSIPPYETRTVMRLRLVGREPANHTAFVQVKTNRSGRFGLVLPVEVEVSARPGLYATVDRLDFGLLRTLDSERTLTLQVTSLFAQPCLVTNVSLDSPNDALKLTYRPVRLLPGAWRRTPLADVTFTAHRALAARQWSGHVIVTGSQDDDGRIVELLRVPYRAIVLQGALVYDANSTRFLLAPSGGAGEVSSAAGVTRPIGISNTFARPVVIFNASLLAAAGESRSSHVSLLNFHPPVVIPAGATRAPFSLSVAPGAAAQILQLAIYSNASHFLIPVFLYTGRLRLATDWPEQSPDTVDFGSLGPGERRRIDVAVRNENPVDVRLLSLQSDSPASLQPLLLRLRRPNGSLADPAGASAPPEMPLTLRPFHQAELSLTAVGPAQPGPVEGQLWIRASPSDLRLTWRLRGAEGSLTAVPDPLLLADCFPSRAACRWLSVRSSFHQLVSVRGLHFLPRDPRFRFAPLGLPQLLKPFETTTVGKICFEHQRLCGQDCYVGFPLTTATGQEWLSGLSLDSRVADVDQLYLGRLAQRWDSLIRAQGSTVNASIAMETAHAGGFLMRAQAQLARPSLLPDGWRHQLQLTHSGNATESELLISNPSDSPVLAQLLPLRLYPSPQAAISLLATRPGAEAWEEEAAAAGDVDEDRGDIGGGAISLAGIGAQSEVARVHRDQLKALFGARVHPDSLATLVPPRRRARFRLAFRPDRAGRHSAVFLLRNNLTALEALLVTGEAAEPQLRLAEPRLLFHASERAGRPCGPIRRQLSLTNPGPLPLSILSYSIGEDSDDDDEPDVADEAVVGHGACSDAGFSLASCQPVRVAPNETLRLDVTFQPDYCLHRVARLLTLRPSAGPSLTVLLQAAVPGPLLSACAARLPRPDWEHQLHTAVALALIACGVCALASAYCESDRLLALDAFLQCRQDPAVAAANSAAASGGAPFDLRNLALTAGISGNSSGNSNSATSGNQHLHHPAPHHTQRILNHSEDFKVEGGGGGGGGGGGDGGFWSGLFGRLLGSASPASSNSTDANLSASSSALSASHATSAAAASSTAAASANRQSAATPAASGVWKAAGSSHHHAAPSQASASSSLSSQPQHPQLSRRTKRLAAPSASAVAAAGKESRSASTASGASSAAPAAAYAASASTRLDPQLIPTPQFEPIDFSNQRVGKGKSRGGGKKQQQQQQQQQSQPSQPISQSRKHQQQEQQPKQQQQQQQQQQHQQLSSKYRRQSCTPEDAEDARSLASESSSSEDKRSNTSKGDQQQAPSPLSINATGFPSTAFRPYHDDKIYPLNAGSSSLSIATASATLLESTKSAEIGINTEDGKSNKSRKNGGGGGGNGSGNVRVKSRSTATNTPNPSVRPSDLQPQIPATQQAKAAPLQPAQKQPKTSIVKPMTHQKPKKGFDDSCCAHSDEEIEGPIEWDIPYDWTYQEELEELARRSEQLSLPQKGSPLWGSSLIGSPSTQSPPPSLLPPPPPPPLPLPLLRSPTPPPAMTSGLFPDSSAISVSTLWPLPPPPPPPIPAQQQQQQQISSIGELSQVTLQKTQSLFNYEQHRREQLQKQQQQLQLQQEQLQHQQQLQLQQEQPLQLAWHSAGMDSLGVLDTSWSESTVSNRNLWGGGIGVGLGGFDDVASGSIGPMPPGNLDDPVARMLMGEQLFDAAGAPAPASSGWTCFPSSGSGDC